MASEARRTRRAALGLALLLLAIGAAAGVAADRLLLSREARPGHPGPPAPEKVLERMRRELRLDEDQARAVSVVLEERWTRLGALFERMDPEAQAIRRGADESIRAVLRPEQRERFEALVQEQERRRAEIRERLRRRAAAPP